jgi:hypothetical protein
MVLMASVSYIYYYHSGIGVHDNRQGKHVVYFLHLLAVYGLGVYVFVKAPRWLLTAWHFTNAAVLLLLSGAAVYELLYQKLPFSWYESLAGLRFYFQTPIPFLVFILMARQVASYKKTA